MAGRDPCKHRSGHDGLAKHLLAGGDGSQGARCWNTKRRHRLAHDVLAQHRAERGSTIAAAREGCRAGAFELNVIAVAVARENLSEQVGAAIAKLRNEVPELMAGISEGERLRAGGHTGASQDLNPFRARQRGGVEPELRG